MDYIGAGLARECEAVLNEASACPVVGLDVDRALADGYHGAKLIERPRDRLLGAYPTDFCRCKESQESGANRCLRQLQQDLPGLMERCVDVATSTW